METVVYTYKRLDYNVYSKEVNQKEWIIKSIDSAKKLNYSTELYTNDEEFSEGLKLDKVHFIDDDYQIWDSFKLWVLENRKDSDYFLSDNDIIYNKRLNFNNVDIHFDGVETQNWEWVYKSIFKYLKSKSLCSNIPFWSYDRQPVYNVGILRIINDKLKNDYIYYWKKLYSDLEPHLSKINTPFITAVITQYLLTLLVNQEPYTLQYFTKDGGWPYNNDYYNHYPGFIKFKNLSLL